MINLIKADLYRMIRSKSIYAVFGVMLIMALVSAFLKAPGTLGATNLSSNDELATFAEEYTAEAGKDATLPDMLKAMDERKTDEERKNLVLRVIGTNMNLYYLIIFIVYGVLAADFSNKSIKNTLTSIASKRKYFKAKLIFISGAALVLIYANTLVFYGLNYIINGEKYTCSLTRALQATAVQLPLLLGLTALLILAVFIFRNGAAFNSVAIGGVLVFQLVLSAVAQVTKWDFLNTFFEKYEIQGALYKLATAPDLSHMLMCELIGAAVFTVSVIAGYSVFRKSEIK